MKTISDIIEELIGNSTDNTGRLTINVKERILEIDPNAKLTGDLEKKVYLITFTDNSQMDLRPNAKGGWLITNLRNR